MKITIIFLYTFLSTVSIQAQTSNTTANREEQALRELINQVNEGKKDIVLADDVYFNSARYHKPIVGRQNLEAERKEVSGRRPRHNQKTRYEPHKLEVAASGDMAYEYGNYFISFTNTANTNTSINGSYLRVWRKDGDDWKEAAAFARPVE